MRILIDRLLDDKLQCRHSSLYFPIDIETVIKENLHNIVRSATILSWQRPRVRQNPNCQDWLNLWWLSDCNVCVNALLRFLTFLEVRLVSTIVEDRLPVKRHLNLSKQNVKQRWNLWLTAFHLARAATESKIGTGLVRSQSEAVTVRSSGCIFAKYSKCCSGRPCLSTFFSIKTLMIWLMLSMYSGDFWFFTPSRAACKAECKALLPRRSRQFGLTPAQRKISITRRTGK